MIIQKKKGNNKLNQGILMRGLIEGIEGMNIKGRKKNKTIKHLIENNRDE